MKTKYLHACIFFFFLSSACTSVSPGSEEVTQEEDLAKVLLEHKVQKMGDSTFETSSFFKSFLTNGIITMKEGKNNQVYLLARFRENFRFQGKDYPVEEGIQVVFLFIFSPKGQLQAAKQVAQAKTISPSLEINAEGTLYLSGLVTGQLSILGTKQSYKEGNNYFVATISSELQRKKTIFLETKKRSSFKLHLLRNEPAVSYITSKNEGKENSLSLYDIQQAKENVLATLENSTRYFTYQILTNSAGQRCLFIGYHGGTGSSIIVGDRRISSEKQREVNNTKLQLNSTLLFYNHGGNLVWARHLYEKKIAFQHYNTTRLKALDTKGNIYLGGAGQLLHWDQTTLNSNEKSEELHSYLLKIDSHGDLQQHQFYGSLKTIQLGRLFQTKQGQVFMSVWLLQQHPLKDPRLNASKDIFELNLATFDKNFQISAFIGLEKNLGTFSMIIQQQTNTIFAAGRKFESMFQDDQGVLSINADNNFKHQLSLFKYEQTKSQ